MIKPNWERIAWSWPVMLLNACCFVFMIMVLARDCAKIRTEEELKRKQELKQAVREAINEQ